MILLENNTSWASEPFPKKALAKKDAYGRTLVALLSLVVSTETQQEQPIDWPDEREENYKIYANLSAEDLIRYTVRAVERGLYHDLCDADGEPVLVVTKERAVICSMKQSAHCPVTYSFPGFIETCRRSNLGYTISAVEK